MYAGMYKKANSSNDSRLERLDMGGVTVEDLAEIVNDLVEQGRGKMKVRIATQPNYPLAHDVRSVIDNQQLAEVDEDFQEYLLQNTDLEEGQFDMLPLAKQKELNQRFEEDKQGPQTSRLRLKYRQFIRKTFKSSCPGPKISNEFGETLWIVAEEGNCQENPYAPKGLWEIDG